MKKPEVHFFTEDISYVLKDKRKLKVWLAETINKEGFALEELNFIFCSDKYLLRLNQDYLSHDTYTDVITFDHSEGLKTIWGDVFISLERVRENAKTYDHSVKTELSRVMIHGTLHLLGYKDKNKTQKTVMTEKENFYLSHLLI